jgi:hypothetical protein
MTPETQADGLGQIQHEEWVRGQAVLCFVITLAKCTRIYFSGVNKALYLLAHPKQRS